MLNDVKFFGPEVGSGCSTVAELMAPDQEVRGSNPAGKRTFFLLISFPTFLQLWSVLHQVPQGVVSLSMMEASNNKNWLPSCCGCDKTGSISTN